VAIYVDDYRVEATVNGIKSRWSHLMAWPPDKEELLAFGEKIGLKKEWLQYPEKPARTHFDVTENKRALAIEHGAQQIRAQDFYMFIAISRVKMND
jgi:hypothetical protein